MDTCCLDAEKLPGKRYVYGKRGLSDKQTLADQSCVRTRGGMRIIFRITPCRGPAGCTQITFLDHCWRAVRMGWRAIR